jgi:hypothetical protein
MMSNRLNKRRLLPTLFIAFALSGCGSSSTTPAVDAKLLQQRLDEFVTAVTKPDPASEVIAKAEGAAKTTRAPRCRCILSSTAHAPRATRSWATASS